MTIWLQSFVLVMNRMKLLKIKVKHCEKTEQNWSDEGEYNMYY
jgi:hypothetical protein